MENQGIINKKINEEIKKIAINYNLDLIILFGSYAKNRVSKESDIDIGIFRKEKLISHEEEVFLNGEFIKLLKNNDIDISIISSNNPLLMFNILKNGKILYSKEDNLINSLRLYSWKLLAESKYFRDHSFSILKKRISSSV